MAAAPKLKAISATDTKERRGRRPLHLCRKLAKPRGKVKQLALVDKRTTFGRLITSFKRDLVLRFVERYARAPEYARGNLAPASSAWHHPVSALVPTVSCSIAAQLHR